MTKKIFHSIMAVTVATMLIVLVIISGVLFEYFDEVQKNALKSEYSLASVAVEKSGADYLSALKKENFRLTLISADGTVLADTSADAMSMENHADREEVKAALASGTGESERYSSTLTEKTMYYAGRLSDGTVLRISVSHASLLSLILGMLQPILFVFLIMIIVSIVLANRMSKHIVEPLNSLDLDNPLENKVYEELSPLLRRINSLQNDVRHQLRALKRKTDEFEQIIDSMNEGLVFLDKDGVIVSINNAAMKLFGVDKQCINQDFLIVDRNIEMQNAVGKAISCGHSEIRLERNGNVYQVNISRIQSDEIAVGVVILAFDVTDKYFAERNRQEFTANVSHELKTPLQSITGSAELIENGLVKPEDMPRFIGHIRSEAARLVTLIEDIIRLSQLDEGIEMQNESIDLYDIVSDVVGELQYAAKAKNIEVKLSGNSITVFGVKKLVSEIVYNLCDNAIKYTNQNGHVTIGMEAVNSSAVITVGDDGIGIPPEHQSRIFERFYRVDKSHSKSSGGTGLGLSIVKHAVQYLHGSIKVESEQGKGTLFTITLPMEKNR